MSSSSIGWFSSVQSPLMWMCCWWICSSSDPDTNSPASLFILFSLDSVNSACSSEPNAWSKWRLAGRCCTTIMMYINIKHCHHFKICPAACIRSVPRYDLTANNLRFPQKLWRDAWGEEAERGRKTRGERALTVRGEERDQRRERLNREAAEETEK